MISLRTFRSNPHFADLFAHVHVICWPILWWQLNALLRWCRREGIPDVLYAVSPWGLITIRHAGTRPGTFYQPLERTFRPLSEPSWESDLPSNIAALETLRLILFLPRAAGGGGIPRSGMTEGAFATLTPNTS
jgi:hypothetical protein